MTALPQETELKLWLHPDEVDAFIRHPRLSRAKASCQALRTLYFDTPDFMLAKKGVALRVRKVDSEWVQTLKTEGEQSGGLSRRLELEAPVAGPLPDFSLLPGKLVKKLVPDKRRDNLKVMYETRFERTAWQLRMPDGSRVEVALDVGEILSGRRTQGLCEVELELKSGSNESLYGLAGLLAQKVMLIPYPPSKAARGARLASGKEPQPVKSANPLLDKRMPICTGFAHILRADLAQLQANLPGLLMDPDPEYCHQARVAIRRLRSAVRLFRKVCAFPDRPLTQIASLGNELGKLRDADVFVLETLPRLQNRLSPEQFGLLQRRARAFRRRQRDSALSAVLAPATGEALIALGHWLEQFKGDSDEGRLGPFATGRLEVMFDRIALSSGQFASYSVDQRHALRVQIKRLRYACEHFSSLIRMKKTFASGLADLQDKLGSMNDQAAALRQIAAMNHDGKLDQVLSAVEGWVSEENRANLSLLGECLQLFSRNRPVW
ncbi:MAG: CHAD domain-containing protein [Hydrogenophilaceae bacterium]|nr:CHAD domain-containing protein [Hydrogenophilaceae bacterium]